MEESELIEAIRARIADPDRRVEARPSEFFAGVQGMSLGAALQSGPRRRGRRATSRTR